MPFSLSRDGKDFLRIRHLLVSSTWVLVGKCGTIIAILMINGLLARMLSPSEMGAYFLTLSLVGAASILGRMGLAEAGVKLIAESIGVGDQRRASALINTVLILGTLGGGLMACFIALGPGQWISMHIFHSLEMSGVMVYSGIWVFVMVLQYLVGECFRGLHHIGWATIFSGTANVGGVLTVGLALACFIMMWALDGEGSLRETAFIYGLCGAITVLVGALMLYRRIGGFRGKESLKLGVWRIAMPLLIVSISNFAVIQADVWILGAYLADEQVAIYAAAARLVALISMPLQIASAVISPTIAALSNQKRHDELERLVRGVATVTGLPSAAVVVSFMFAGESILGLVYGDYYRAGASVLVLLSLARLVYAWTGPCGILLIMSGHQGSAMWITVVSSMVSVAGAFFFVRFGVIGVAASFAAGMAIENICMTVYGVLAIGIKSYMSLRSLGLGR